MSPAAIDRGVLERLAALLLERVGLKITPDGYAGLRLALLARLPRSGLADAGAYVRRLERPAGEGELRSLLPLVTVGKTEFFRDFRQFQAFEGQVLPALLEAGRAEGRRVRVWSAGCATGEEPYSIAMAALERGATPASLEIWATDLNPAALEAAQAGQYGPRRLGGLTAERLQRFLEVAPGGHQVVPAVRALVRFEAHNLAAPAWPEVGPSSLDAVFCRNVLIYFDQQGIEAVLARFYQALRPGGWLLLGYSESLLRFGTRFETVELGGTFTYRRPAVRGFSGDLPLLASPSAGRVPARPAVASRPAAGPPDTVAGPPTPQRRLEEVVAAIEQGDFPRALRLARQLVEDQPQHLAARLTLGNVQVLLGSLDEAREALASAVQQEPLCMEAHLYLGVAALQASQLDQARVELGRALFLEPTLALGHFLLGQVQERRGDLQAARRAYRNVLLHRGAEPRRLVGHFPDLPLSAEALARSAGHRLAALS